jgi:DNA excision repair protein ERCC-2
MRFDDRARTLSISVRDLVEAAARTGHLVLEGVRADTERLAAGRDAHVELQGERAAVDPAYRAEVRVRHLVGVADWMVEVHGRVDGLVEEADRTVVEEIKSTLLDASRLLPTGIGDWPEYAAQLEVYLWMLHEARRADPVGRLVFVSLTDGSRHVLPVPLDAARVGATVRGRLAELCAARDRRIAWMSDRRSRGVPWTFDGWRRGQREVAEAVRWALDEGRPALVEAPTGAGKTAAVMHGVLGHAFATDKQAFWTTARTTQQEPLCKVLDRLVDAGLPVRGVQITAKEKACLNGVVACRPDACAFASGYHDKLRASGLAVAMQGKPGVHRREGVAYSARAVEVCPYQLALDLLPARDVVVGDYGYVFDPSVRLRSAFGEDASGEWVVVADEVHQLVERGRAFLSPRLDAALARTAAERLGADPVRYGPVAELARDVADRVVALAPEGPEAPIELAEHALSDLARRVADLALPYAWAKVEAPRFAPGERDAWLETARAVLRVHEALQQGLGPHLVALGRGGPAASVRLLCLDPAPLLGPLIRSLGGFVGVSATVRPTEFFRDNLGLDPERLEVVTAPSPFPPDNLRVLVAPRISTAFRDRVAHAQPTADLIDGVLEAVDGNVVVYFPSFEMLDDLVGRLRTARPRLLQTPGMTDAQRDTWLARLSGGGPPVLAAAVLGGVFAEGIDPPPGAVAAIVVVGPALPPVGLERDLLRDYYERRFGQGFRYASLVPGLTRVVQAAGRLVRREEDRGTVVLVDRRFRWREVADLLPPAWRVEVADDPAAALRVAP